MTAFNSVHTIGDDLWHLQPTLFLAFRALNMAPLAHGARMGQHMYPPRSPPKVECEVLVIGDTEPLKICRDP